MSCSNNMKQFGLAIHNYHDTANTIPPYGFDFVTNNPDPANPYGMGMTSWQGHSLWTMLLPMIEQANAINNPSALTTNLQYSVVDPANLPSPIGTSTSGLSTIKVYQCPSAPSVAPITELISIQ